MTRAATVRRETRETRVTLELGLEGGATPDRAAILAEKEQ